MQQMPTIAYPPELPVSARREDLLAAISANQVVVVAGETGSGKTTQLPKLCLELGRTAIAHTQPRRIAARTVAERIAEELQVPLGAAVGYAVRFDDRSRRESLIRVVTDGLLLNEINRDRLLRRYDTIIVDEAHERSLNIDFLLGWLVSILPRRPDLKVVITSATIDPGRFAAHFGEDAPVVEVSGRTYPVEVRYAPVADDADPLDAVADAVESLSPLDGDVLVFLSGEREIRDAADLLAGRFDDLEILPLYARLAAVEQQRVFRTGSRRRVVLATNVAETSLTVPGIRYVVDTGTARISRYSARLKVQRLPIEPVSQASASQRAGRCGRLGPGVCIRLYSEEDFLARPEFTDPEILRTSLAAVILQMASARLGEIESFPFLDPPDRRQVRDGVNLLVELGALTSERRLTKIGRRLASLPVDPRMGRMVLEADKLGCADEVIVIAAALSIQDPRERPADHQAAADQSHTRFADERSDFLAFWNLWTYLRAQQKALSGNQFRKRCRAEYLHYLRVREWQDLAGQLRSAARAAGVHVNREAAEPDEIHRALLAGLLSHVGMRDRRDYVGARDARFGLWPGSSVKPAPWIMVAELVETSRLWGRVAARIDPRWIEPLAGHLVRRSYSEPRWDRGRASVVASERVTLYGLPIVSNRTVGYGRIDPLAARELFIRRALVEGDWDTKHAFVARNAAVRRSVEELEERTRRRDILVDDSVLFDFFASRIPSDVVSGAHFDRWFREQPQDLLDFTPELLTRGDASLEGRPDSWKQGDLVMKLSYRFEPGSESDGVTVHVPLRALASVRDEGFDWLVPAFRLDLVTALIRSLPKELRRQLVPAPSVAAAVLPLLRPRRGRFVDAVASALSSIRPVRVPPDAFDVSKLPPHLRMRFRVEDSRGAVMGEADSLAELRVRLGPRLRAELASAARGFERTGLTSWDGIDALPRAVALPGTGKAVRAYPALVDEGSTVGVRVLETVEAQRAAMRLGTRRLLLLTVGVPSPRPPLQFATAPHGSAAAVVEDCVAAAVDALVEEAGGPAFDSDAFAALRTHVASELHDRTDQVVAQVVRILDAEREVRRRLETLTAPALRPVVDDVAEQLRRLLPPGFVATTGVARLADLERFLHAAARRLDRAPSALAADLDRMRTIHELESAARDRPDLFWDLQELRVAQFAEGLARRGVVAVKKLRRQLEPTR
ncbi:MAG TPA: ATP-dependent RNA helicase HrpA [Solirubrobacteraceae bacterium]|nr:ATP-dependent RNA helicase HrpA [Solirubrobacteraceae bacterium]